MNHFISGILKIVLLEGSIALLLMDALAPDRLEKVRLRAHAVLAGLMVFAWANWGSLRYDIEVGTALSSIPVILLCGFLTQLAFDEKRTERLAAFTAWARATPKALGGWLFGLGLVALGTVGFLFGAFPANEFFTHRGGLKLAFVVIAAISARIAMDLTSGGRLEKLVAAFDRRAKPIAIAVVVITSGAWVSGGVVAGRLNLVHTWEQFHFYLGAKYQRELGWFNLYKAAILADRETVNVLRELPTTRELTTFEQVPIDVALKDAAEVRARFSDAQWENFKNDWATLTRVSPINWTNVMNDHGNSNSPAWALFAAPLAKLVPVSREGQAFLGWIDMLLMLGLWLVVWRTFGHRVASVGLFMWATPPIVFDYLSGSFLRWDWLFAIGLAACFLKQKRYALAGGFFGFAFATKLFPIFFGVALGVRALFVWRQTKEFKREYLRFGLSAAAVGGGIVLLSTIMFGTSAWKEYAQRIQVAQVEKFYAIQYSFKSVYLQHAALPSFAWAQTIFPGELAQRRNDVETCGAHADSNTGTQCLQELSACGDNHRFTLSCENGGACTCSRNGAVTKQFTRELPCAQSDAEFSRLFEVECGFPKDYSFGFFVGRVLFTLLLLLLLWRAEDVEAFLIGPLLVFTWLVVNMYYWNMLGLLAMGLLLRADRPKQKPAFAMLLGLHVIFMVYYLYQHLNRGISEGFAVAWMITVLVIITAVSEALAIRRELTSGSSASPPPAR
jgi:hypothetical protein